MMPVRRKKKAGELVQKYEAPTTGGRYDRANAVAASSSPPARKLTFSLSSEGAVRDSSIHVPSTAPAGTNADHGKTTKFERPPAGRRYASTASGSIPRKCAARTAGV